MSKVYFLKGFEKIKEKSKELFKGFYPEGAEVMVKIHFGEPGNKFAFQPKDIKPIIEAIKSLDLKPVFIDTPVAYLSPRDSVDGYKKAVKKKGYDKLAPFIISNSGVNVKTRDFTAEVCRELVEAKSVLIISHVKGHSCAGFGGAIKNLAMGGVTKETKNIVHSLCKPKFVSECLGCGICAEYCPAKAIKMVGGKAKPNLDSCYGCSICQIECPYKCLEPQKALFDDLLGQAGAAVIDSLPRSTFYINIIKNITKLCDCEIDPLPVISEDIGVLFSENPIAIDKASVDLVIEANKRKNVFKEQNHKDPLLHINFAFKYTKRRMDYELIEL